MAKKSAANKAKRQQARAKKRAKRAKQVKAKLAVARAEESRSSTTSVDHQIGDWASSRLMSKLLERATIPPLVVVLNPYALVPDDLPDALPEHSADAPDVVAIPYKRARDSEWGMVQHTTSVALYRRRPSNEYVLISPYELPDHTEVHWYSDEPFDRTAECFGVQWSVEPEKTGDTLRGELVIRRLVWDGFDVVWAPKFPLVGTAQPDGSWELRIGLGLLDGELRGGRVEWTSGGDVKVADTIAAFLDSRASDLAVLTQRGEAPPEPVDPVALVAAICGPSPTYKRQEVNALVAHQSVVLPVLVEYLETLDPEMVDPDDWGAMYALAVVAHTRCTEAHPALLALARRSDEAFEMAFSDMITEGFSSALLMTSGGDTQGIAELLTDSSAGPYLRSAAATALAGAVLLGHVDRQEVLERLAGLLTSEQGDADTEFLGGVAVAMLHLFPVEHTELLIRTSNERWMDDFVFGESDVHHIIASGPAVATERSPCPQIYYSTDVHRWLRPWHCFSAQR